MTTPDARIDRLESLVEQLALRVTAVEATLGQMNLRLGSMESRLDSLESRMMQMFLAILAVMMTGFIALGVAILTR